MDGDELPTNSIDVEFADVTKHRTIRFSEQYGFTMADLCALVVVMSATTALNVPFTPRTPPLPHTHPHTHTLFTLPTAETGAVFASDQRLGPPDKASAHPDRPTVAAPSSIVFRGFGSSFTTNWRHQLPEGEVARAVAVGGTFAACATSADYLRVFCAAGSQALMVCLPGPVVTLAAEGQLLGAVYHRASPSGASQVMGYVLYRVGAAGFFTKLASGDMPLAAGSLLSWFGFSSNHTLVAVDSTGVVRGLAAGTGWEWVPLFDTSTDPLLADKPLTAWVIGVDGDQLMCVLCRNSTPEPKVLSAPVTSTLRMRLPLLDMKGRGGQEEAVVRDTLRLGHMQWATDVGLPLWADGTPEAGDPAASGTPALVRARTGIDKQTLRMIQAACKDERDARALELAARLHLPKSMELAVRVAQKCRRSQLAQALFDRHDRMVREQAKAAAAAAPRASPPRARIASSPPTSAPAGDAAAAAVAAAGAGTGTGTGIGASALAGRSSASARRKMANPRKRVAPPRRNSLVEDSAAEEAAPPSPPSASKTPVGRQRAANPFAKAVMASPSKRQRGDVFQALASGSPQKPKGKLSRQSSFSMAARQSVARRF